MELLTVKQAADYLNFDRKTLYSWRANGKGPRSFRIEGKIAYAKADLDAFILDSYTQGTEASRVASL
ncbi:MAG: helix-turn-helix transcriptional regulator [Mycolicibacterium sp.]|uniref:helix-turn-helix transcriptional regulator n=1 Tax=Mycolicibacterium sp. TaxID=2320850 RepID=UPI003D12DC17